uniref:Uncharacterized protein n=1 Tax=Eucampia antarctica TaxID=49252 RepID=A0A7S2WAD2_9STRA|mmetsp:Transcript_24814/g.23843  ORF Transcript_24814/g.23843 Transcript_24814/m.23843 type:complete len:252 (+) Transcript_24814:66-821(+)|eukprot:CAMPEP_0197833180 /NCGR_PEP_ID=MMETSP1437-20131217/18106_1 /TAXON_ID=49252 ORGANISM="Eucampia antarctica, Strain CCMP1452" /NCGR_SAMPLE_ID=MMETSP1437 /ASSEMBLY_ACC=CAM_ASM_001096 /LENGTH=251 /DNA_ID=CAMNT_0043437071 /DNA_START=66 /DNA_END=821 /DNA_ORIENTATION=+
MMIALKTTGTCNKRRFDLVEDSPTTLTLNLLSEVEGPLEPAIINHFQISKKSRIEIGNESKPIFSVTTMNPDECLLNLFKTNELDASLLKESTHDDDFFLEHTKDQMNSYDNEVIAAIRTQDIATLREMHADGRDLQCCNRFGESLIHMACRRGFLEVVQFLVLEADVSVQIRDDYGRTPMHDACWGCEPNFILMDLLIELCPELLLVSDRRGHTPLQYTRREHWKLWSSYLQSQGRTICKILSRSEKNLI